MLYEGECIMETTMILKIIFYVVAFILGIIGANSAALYTIGKEDKKRKTHKKA